MIVRLWDRSRSICGCLTAIAIALLGSSASAQQTWSLERQRPSLFEIVSIDESAQPAWPFGDEDIDVPAIDLRSVYADARSSKLWLRAYVAATNAPAMTTVAFFFIDTDARTNTGGAARGDVLWPAFTEDETPGGYERAVGVRGDGTLLGVYFWEDGPDRWTKQPETPVRVEVEVGVARDPLRMLGDDHGYLQVELDLPTFQLDEACDGTIYVRTWNDVMGAARGGDEAEPAACRARLNAFGDPEPLQSARCSDDDACPARGECRDGTCVFAYECSQNAECRSDERCTSSVCVKVVDRSCDATSDCDGLVCVADRCESCSDSGARACADGLVCTPSGACIRPADANGGSGGSGGRDGSGGSEGAAGARVQGGAFTCSAGPHSGAAGVTAFSIFALWAAATYARMRRRGRSGGSR